MCRSWVQRRVRNIQRPTGRPHDRRRQQRTSAERIPMLDRSETDNVPCPLDYGTFTVPDPSGSRVSYPVLDSSGSGEISDAVPGPCRYEIYDLVPGPFKFGEVSDPVPIPSKETLAVGVDHSLNPPLSDVVERTESEDFKPGRPPKEEPRLESLFKQRRAIQREADIIDRPEDTEESRMKEITGATEGKMDRGKLKEMEVKIYGFTGIGKTEEQKAELRETFEKEFEEAFKRNEQDKIQKQKEEEEAEAASTTESKGTPVTVCPPNTPQEFFKPGADDQETPRKTRSPKVPDSEIPDNEMPSPVEKDGSPVEKDGSPVEKDGSPVEKDGSPVEKDGSPVEKDGSPVEKDGSPVEKDGSPVEKDGSPVEKDGSPVEKDGSPVEKDDENAAPQIIIPKITVTDYAARLGMEILNESFQEVSEKPKSEALKVEETSENANEMGVSNLLGECSPEVTVVLGNQLESGNGLAAKHTVDKSSEEPREEGAYSSSPNMNVFDEETAGKVFTQISDEILKGTALREDLEREPIMEDESMESSVSSVDTVKTQVEVTKDLNSIEDVEQDNVSIPLNQAVVEIEPMQAVIETLQTETAQALQVHTTEGMGETQNNAVSFVTVVQESIVHEEVSNESETLKREGPKPNLGKVTTPDEDEVVGKSLSGAELKSASEEAEKDLDISSSSSDTYQGQAWSEDSSVRQISHTAEADTTLKDTDTGSSDESKSHRSKKRKDDQCVIA